MNKRSTIARLQQLLAALVVAGAGAWLGATWNRAPLLAIAGAVAIVFWSSVFLAIEMILLRIVGDVMPTPRPRVGELVRAWAMETLLSVSTFLWRQPFRWRAVPDLLETTSRAPGVILVHGYLCNRGFWNPWLRTLRQRGQACIAVNLEPPFGSIDDCVHVVERAVRQITDVTKTSPVLVCHSMGGLVVRAWLRTTTPDRVRHIVTIGTPHRGTWLGQFSHMRNGREMRPDSAWLRELNADVSSPARFTCWYSNCDNVVFPVSSATLPGADNRLVLGPAHVELAFHPAVMAHVLSLTASC